MTSAPAEPPASGFLAVPEPTADVQSLYDHDRGQLGFVMNASRVWAHGPEAHAAVFDLIAASAGAAGLSYRDRGIAIAACASTLRDRYCSLAWGNRLAGEAGADLAAMVLRGTDDALDDRERALARWARTVAADANATRPQDVDDLRAAGFDDRQIFALTLFVAMRITFAKVNDALGATPDPELIDAAPAAVAQAITYGREQLPVRG